MLTICHNNYYSKLLYIFMLCRLVNLDYTIKVTMLVYLRHLSNWVRFIYGVVGGG